MKEKNKKRKMFISCPHIFPSSLSVVVVVLGNLHLMKRNVNSFNPAQSYISVKYHQHLFGEQKLWNIFIFQIEEIYKIHLKTSVSGSYCVNLCTQMYQRCYAMHMVNA